VSGAGDLATVAENLDLRRMSTDGNIDEAALDAGSCARDGGVLDTRRWAQYRGCRQGGGQKPVPLPQDRSLVRPATSTRAVHTETSWPAGMK
jgi:hypothetical protein